MQRIAEIAVRFGEIRAGGDGLALRQRRFLVVFQFVERDAEIAQGRRHRRLDFERAPRLRHREPRPSGEAEHLAEIGMKQSDVWGELGRPLHMLDRLAKLAVLVGDDAEQVLGLRQVGLCLQHLPANRVGLHQPALGAATLGIAQRLAERHDGGIRLAGDVVHGSSLGRLDTMDARRRPR